MVTVGDDVSVVELDLGGGRLACPGCGGRLRPWGWAQPRGIREGWGQAATVERHRPRRARCVGCGGTHVLLAASLAARRADGVGVIAAAVEAKVVLGRGHRWIAAWLGRPASTVRGWLRAFASAAGAITVAFMALTVRDAPDAAALWPRPSRDAARALAVLGAYAAAVGQRFGLGTVTWARAGITATSGWLFSAAWWARTGQHELALTRGGGGTGGSH